MRPEIITAPLVVWTWTLLPASVHFSIAGRETEPVMVSGGVHTAPYAPDQAIVELGFRLDSTTIITLDGPSSTAESHATAIVEGSMSNANGTTHLSWNTSLISTRDFNGQELLHLKATASTSTEAPIVLDAWFLRTDPAVEYTPFCSSDE